jgi:hypothetical protein
VSASVIYDAATQRATLDPTTSLQANVTYTATVKGGAAGARDLARNPLSADRVCSFAVGNNTPPTVAIQTPVATQQFKVGDTITFSGTWSDAQDATLPDANLVWEVTLQHCTNGSCHSHPGFHQATGLTGSFVAPDHGDGMFFEIAFTVADSAGLSSTATVAIQPRTVQLTLATNPSAMQVVLAGSGATAPQTYTVIVGSQHTITAPSPQSNAQDTYVFASWSDGQPQQHNITIGEANATYTATFAPAPPGTYVSDRTPTTSTNGWGPIEKDRSNGENAAGDGRPITLNGVVYTKGLGVHAVLDVRYSLVGLGCTEFQSDVGVDDEVGASGSVVFEVWGDTSKLYDSGIMTGTTATKAVKVDVTGRAELRLVVTDGGNDFAFDHADWAGARLTCGASPDTTPPTVTLNQSASQADPAGTAPVRFTAVFSEPVTGFDSTDVSIGGSAPGTKTASVTPVGTCPCATYDVAVSGMTGNGTVTVSLGTGVAADQAGNPSAASTSVDNTVTYQAAANTLQVHVGDLDARPQSVNKNQWRATVTVTVHDDAHRPVNGASVAGTWSSGSAASGSCTTTANGQCSITTGNIPTTTASTRFTVGNVSGAGLQYVPSDNHEPDGDSSGTVITISKP